MKIAPRYASLPACSISVISTLEATRTQDLLKSIIPEQRSPLNVKLFITASMIETRYTYAATM